MIQTPVYRDYSLEQGRPRDYIERVAETVLENYNIDSIPVDPIYLARMNNVEVKNAVFHDADVAGYIVKSGRHITIFIHPNDPPNRKKFTIAHELGHYFLHLAEVDGDFIEYRGAFQYEFPEKEREANAFAAALLMPRRFVEKLWHEGWSLEEMAMEFAVSQEAMKYRLINLGYLSVWG